jgi:hypothetical protein
VSKSRVTAEQEMRQLNVKVLPQDSEFIQEVLRPQLGVPYNADVVLEVISRFRTWFHAPRHVLTAVKQDAEAQEPHVIGPHAGTREFSRRPLRLRECYQPGVSSTGSATRVCWANFVCQD